MFRPLFFCCQVLSSLVPQMNDDVRGSDLPDVYVARVTAVVREFADSWKEEKEELQAAIVELQYRNAVLTAQLSAVQQTLLDFRLPPVISPRLPVVVQQMETCYRRWTAAAGSQHAPGPSTPLENPSLNLDSWENPPYPPLVILPTPATPAPDAENLPKPATPANLPTPATPSPATPATTLPPPYGQPPTAPPPVPPAADADTLLPAVKRLWYYKGMETSPPSPAVHVLLSPGGRECNAPAPDLEDEDGEVFVMGLPKSGTQALARYLSEHFHVDVQPIKGEHEGTVNLKSCLMWTHTVPIGPVVLPEKTSMGPVIVMICVRDIES